MGKVVALNHPLEEITKASRDALMAANEAASGPRTIVLSLLHASSVALASERMDRQHAKDWIREQSAILVDLVYDDLKID
jgi:hypothetical protein